MQGSADLCLRSVQGGATNFVFIVDNYFRFNQIRFVSMMLLCVSQWTMWRLYLAFVNC